MTWLGHPRRSACVDGLKKLRLLGNVAEGRRGPVVVGIDLSLVRPSAVAVFEGCRPVYYALAMEDLDVARTALLLGPQVVAVDAPLTPGPRDVERVLRGRGYRLLPPHLGAMRRLAERGMRLASMLSGTEVVEVHPRTSLKALGIDRASLARILEVDHDDVLDAAAAALTALAYIGGLAERIGPFVLPKGLPCGVMANL